MKHRNLEFCYLLLVLFLFSYMQVQAQVGGTTRIYTDFQGYWTSGSGAGNLNPIRPNNTHHLLGFTWQGQTFSTGVNDATLTANGVTFTAKEFQAFPVRSIGFGTGTYIGLGQLVDGVDNGISTPPPFPLPVDSDILATFLTRGTRGLDFGSGVANVAAGTLIFDFGGIIDPTKIGDGIPDVIVSQFAQPAGSLDQIFFTNASGVLVGNAVSINHNTYDRVGIWSADFYTLTGGNFNVRTERDLRLWAADLASFGINASNYTSVVNIRYQLNGQSDPAFLAFSGDVIQLITANDDLATTAEDTPVLIDILSNDQPIVILNPATISITQAPANGSITINPTTGAINYTPNPGYSGTDSFRYQVCNFNTTSPQCDDALVTVVVTPIPLPAIQISKSANRTSFGNIGDVINYTLTIQNTGNTVLTAVRITDPKLSFDETVASVAAGATVIRNISYTVTAADFALGIIQNIAAVDGTSPNAVVVSDSDNLDICLGFADDFNTGSYADYVTDCWVFGDSGGENQGGGGNNVGINSGRIISGFPNQNPFVNTPFLSFQGSTTVSFNYSAASNNRRIVVELLNELGNVVGSNQVNFNAGSGSFSSVFNFTGTARIRFRFLAVSGANTGVPSLIYVDNLITGACLNTSIGCSPPPLADLRMVKTVSNNTPNVGEVVSFLLTATNLGLSPATGVNATDLIPSGYNFVSATASQGTYNSLTGVWAIGNLALNANATLSIVATVLGSGDYLNSSSVTGTEVDPNSGNNTSSVTPRVRISNNTISSNQSLCIGAPSAELMGTVPVGGNGNTYTYQWQISTDGSNFTDIAGANSSNYLPGTLAATRYFRRSVSSTPASGGPILSTSNIVTITISTPPAVANAGANQALCNVTSTNLAATPPAIGVGTWSLLSGPNTPSFTNVNSPVSPISGLITGTYEFQWTVSSGACPPSEDQVTITVSTTPSIASAGLDQVLCGGSATTLMGNTPAVGTGFWTVESGSGVLLNPSNPTTTISGLGVGQTILKWTITSGACGISESLVTITLLPDISNNSIAADQNILLGQNASALIGSEPLGGDDTFTYQWQVSINGGSTWTTISGASDRDYNPGAVTQTSMFRRLVQSAACFLNTSTPVSITVLANADLAVTKTVDNQFPTVGSTITFTITATNNGPSDASGVSVVDSLPSGYTYISHVAPIGTTYDDSTGIWTINDLALHASVVLTIVVMVQ